MATYIKTLKEDNGDITYPQTKGSAVLLNNGSDLETELSQYVTAEDIASTSAVTPTITTAMIVDGAVTSDKIDWSTLLPELFKTYEMPATATYTPSSAWTNYNMGDPLTVTGLDPDATYTLVASTPWVEGKGEFRLYITGASSYQQRPYNSTGLLIPVVYQIQGIKPTSSGSLTFQRSYSGEVVSIRTAQLYITLIRTA